MEESAYFRGNVDPELLPIATIARLRQVQQWNREIWQNAAEEWLAVQHEVSA